MTAEMSQTPADTFSILNNADLVFPEIEDESGEKVRITHGRYGQFLQLQTDVCAKMHSRIYIRPTNSF